MKYIQHLYPIISKEILGKNLFSYVIQCPDLASIAKPGQFVHILPNGKTLRRPISICEIHPEQGTIRIVFEAKGEGTVQLACFNTGDCMDILGPLGNGFTILPKDKKIILIGGGIGTPPMVALAQHYKKNATVISGFRSAGLVMLQQDFSDAGAHTILCTDNGTAGQHAMVTEPLKECLSQYTPDLICACGPIPMLKAIAAIANEKNIACEVSLEERMGCGIGACLVCACKLNRNGQEVAAHVCKDGPVFSSKEVIW